MKYTTIDIEDKAEIYKLRDKTGRIQFLVEFLITDNNYIVKVCEIDGMSIPHDVIRTEYNLDDKETAYSNFKQLIDDYSLLIDVDDKDKIKPDDVFKTSVNYHQIDPDRCGNCEFSDFIDFRHHPFLMCRQHRNIKQRENIQHEFDKGGSYQIVDGVHVSEFGVCNNYQREHIMRNNYGINQFDLNKFIRNDHDLIDLIMTMQENRLVEFENEIYVKNGKMNPKFHDNVLSVINENSDNNNSI